MHEKIALSAMVLRQSDSLVYARSHGGRIKLSAEVIASVQSFVQNDRHKPESGGVMLGRYILDSQDVVIDKMSFPMSGDRANRFTFFRNKKAHQQIIDREWEASNRTCTYLGEWHTHPEQRPVPSCIDLFNWKRKLKKDVFDSDFLFFLIVGTSEMRMWEGYKRLKTISLLTLL